MFTRTIAEQFAAESDPEIVAAMLAEFGLEVIKRFGPEYLSLREQIDATSVNSIRRN